MDVMLEQPKVELDLGGWTDISSYVKYSNRISITRGRSSEGSRALDQSTCSMTLLNHDGRFSPRNPTSPYYGVLGRNTPIRVSLESDETYLNLTAAGAAATTSSEAVDITGDTDIRIDMHSDQWFRGILCSKNDDYPPDDPENAEDEPGWKLSITDSGRLLLEWWSDDGFGFPDEYNSAEATELLPVTCGRMAVRATLDADNGSSGHTVTFYTSDTISGSWTQLGDAVVGTGTTSIWSGTAPTVKVGGESGFSGETVNQVPGHCYAFELRDGIGGTLAAQADFTAQTPGDESFTDAQGNLWTVTEPGYITDRLYRFWGEVSEWPPRSDISGTDVTVSITATGVQRRMAQGSPSVRSAMHQWAAHPDNSGVYAYWPLEDGKFATRLEGVGDLVQPGIITGTPSMASYSNWTASGALPQMDTGKFAFRVPPMPSGSFELSMFVFAATPAVAAETSLLRVRMASSVAEIDIRLTTGGDLRVRAYDPDHASLDDTTSDFNVYQRGFFILTLIVSDGGDGNVYWQVVLRDFTNTDLMTAEVEEISDGVFDTPGTFTRATRIFIGDDQALTNTFVGHLVISDGGDTSDIAFQYLNAVAAYNGENPEARISRLLRGEGIPRSPVTEYESLDYPDIALDSTVRMGDQLAKSWSDLVTEAAEADQGILYEMKDRPGIGYRSRLSLYNQTPALSLDHSAHELSQSLAPTDDDQHLVNDIAVTREAGSTFHAEQTGGLLGTDTAGRVPGTATLSLSSDTQLPDQAGWRLHLGTVDEARHPAVQVHLAHPSIDSDKRLEALRTDIGGRILITDPPSWLPPEDISQLVIGYSETIDQFEHVITFVCQPESPWHVGQVEVDGYDRLDTAGSFLAADATSTATALTVASTGKAWSSTAVPYDVMVAGERCTVTAVSDAENDDFDRTEATGWGTAPSGAVWAVQDGSASDHSVSGGVATASHGATGTLRRMSLPVIDGDLEEVAVEIEAEFSTPQLAATSALFFYLNACVDNDVPTWLSLRMRLLPTTNVLGLAIEEGAPDFTLLTSEYAVPGITVAVDTWYHAKMQVKGGVVRGKVWQDGNAEPGWMVRAANTEYTGGTVGLETHVPASFSGTVPFAAKWRNFVVSSPQAFTVTRSVNGIVKAQSAGALVTVPDPVYVAL